MKLREFSTSGLVGHWKMNEGRGVSTADSSPQSNTGTITEALWVSGKRLGKALDFDGVNDRVNVTGHTSLEPSKISIEAWVKVDTLPSAAYGVVVGKQDAAAAVNGYVFFGTTGNKFSWAPNYGAGIDSTTTVVEGVWYHVVCVHNGTAANNRFIYVDGVLENTGTQALAVAAGKDLSFGAKDNASNPIDIKIDEVKIYNRALSADEIKRHYAVGKVVLPVKKRGRL